MRRGFLKWGLYLCLGTLLGAGAAVAHFFQQELRAWAQGPSLVGQQPDKNGGKGKVLPIPEPVTKPITEIDARKAKAPPRFEVKPPKGAPNIVIVLLDDIGFAHSSAFGGPIKMKTAERLAKSGLKYNRFHTCALCSPTRMALLTGRNHHSCNTGAITELATAFSGNTGVRPASIATLAEMLRLWGYITGAFGKYHETAAWEISPSGPFDRWPTRSGFDKFYGFFGGETNQFYPLIYDGVTRVEPPPDPNYHFTTDMTNKAIQWMQSTRSLTPDRPFYMYYATGATHAPHQAPKDYIEKYKGKFAGGWDQMREETLKRQIDLGVVPAGTKLTPMPKDVKAWSTLNADEKKLFERQMEVFAGFAEHTDDEIGRLVDALEGMGQLDNTLFMYIIGDNGASAEGTLNGTFNEIITFNDQAQLNTVASQLKRLDEFGGPMSYNHFAVGWAIAGNTPFQWCKQMASFFGGTRDPLIVHWPKGIKAKGEVRTQFHHVIDICPTVLEAVGVPQPDIVNGIRQKPIEGVSILYSFDDAKAKDRRTTQYFEMFGNRAIYHEGWTACVQHSIPWDVTFKPPPFDKDRWELYNIDEDFSQSNDLAAKNPAKLKELQELFLKEAVKYNVLPLDDRRVERFVPEIAGRPDLMGKRKKLTVYEGMTGISENAFINTKNKSHTITAEVEIPKDGGNGVIFAQGGRFAGYSLYMKEGKVKFVYNWLDADRYTIAAAEKLPPGKATIRYEFAYDGGPPGSGGKGTIFVNDKKVAEGKIANTIGYAFGIDEGADVGIDEGTPVTEDYGVGNANRFNGRIRHVTIELK
jgi:arylsulfatase A-like enzyme